jgi:hypothetical protein
MATLNDFLKNIRNTKNTNPNNPFNRIKMPNQTGSLQSTPSNRQGPQQPFDINAPRQSNQTNQSKNTPSSNTSINNGATSPVAPVIEPAQNTPTDTQSQLSEQGQQFAKTLQPERGRFERKDNSERFGQGNETQTAPVQQEAPINPFDSYLKTLSGESFTNAFDKQNKDLGRLADIQNESEEQQLGNRRDIRDTRDASGGLKGGAQKVVARLSRRGGDAAADLALRESAAARTASVSSGIFQQMLDQGATLREAEQAQAEADNKTLSLEEAQSLGLPFGTTMAQAKEAGVIPQSDGGDGFTLGEGQQRFDSQGNLIAQGIGNDSEGQENGISPVTGKAFTDSQAKAGAFASRTEQAEDVLSKDKFIFNPLTPAGLKSEDRRLFEQAENNFITAVLRRESGAAIAPDEYKTAREVYIPRATDPQSVLDQKAATRKIIIQSLKNESVGYYEQLQQSITGETADTENSGVTSSGINYSIEGFSKVEGDTNQALNLPQRNKNPGNVKTGGLGDKLATGVDDQGHLIFPTEEAGFQALEDDIRAKISGNSRFVQANPTIAELGKVYAEDPNWGRSVARIVGASPETRTSSISIDKLVQAIARQEGYYA